LDSYHVEDIGFFLWDSRSISSSISLRNIFDVNYEEEYGYPMAGRTIWLGMDWQWRKT
jgi:outer membrane cobalamin receptor